MTEPLPHIQRVEIIREYGKQFGLRTFIETGTAQGFTVSNLIEDFDSLLTIEIDEGLYEAARERFEKNYNVHCIQADSGKRLEVIVGTLQAPVLFWLDGHYCGGPGRGDIDTPIRNELQAALHAPAGSVILIDDARLFEGGSHHTPEFADYPPQAWVQTMAIMNGFDYELKDDVMRLTPCSK